MRQLLWILPPIFASSLLRTVAADDTLLVRLPTEVATPRALGLGGALVGLGDAASFIRNPASLIAVPRSFEIVGAGGNNGGHAIAVAVHPYRTLAAGLLAWTADRRFELVNPSSDRAGILRPKDGRWAALGLAWTPLDRRLSIGAAAEAAYLGLLDDAGRASSTQTWVNVTFGAFVQPDGPDGTRVGVAYRFGMDRTFAVQAGALNAAEADASYRVRRPDVLSFGASWRYGWLKNWQVTFTVQPEVVLYGNVLGSSEGSELDLRTGMEVSIPRGDCVSGCGGLWQFRAGLVSRSGIPTLVPTFNDGYDPGRRSTTVVGGASFAHERLFSGKLRLDVGYSRACDSLSQRCDTWMTGVSYRFPSAFRGDLQHHRARR
jgi:hypothetical protein